MSASEYRDLNKEWDAMQGTPMKMKRVSFRIDASIFQTAENLGLTPNKIAKQLLLDYIQEKIVTTPTPEQLLIWILSLKKKAEAYHSSKKPCVDHKLVCKWVCEKYNISPKQFYAVITKTLSCKENRSPDGRWKLGVAQGMYRRPDDLFVTGKYWKFIEFYYDLPEESKKKKEIVD